METVNEYPAQLSPDELSTNLREKSLVGWLFSFFDGIREPQLRAFCYTVFVKDVIQKLTQDILDNGYFLSLATFDDGGLWVSDLFYVADDDWNIYWLSARNTRHSKAIERHPNVAGTITITTIPEDPSEALQIAGRVEVVKEELNEEIAKLFLQKRGKEKKPEANKDDGGQAWYKLIPTKMRLSHQETFELEKQDVEVQSVSPV